MKLRENGFTLVELSSAMVASTILVIAFASILVFINNQIFSAAGRVDLQRDIAMFDRYLREQMLFTESDSLIIYADALAEQNGLASNSGSILVTQDINDNQYRLALLDQYLEWSKNTLSYEPVEARVLDLNFEKSGSFQRPGIAINMSLFNNNDTLNCEWNLAFRN